ncbi:MAG: hypothetical protein RLZ92_1853 [Pseudomonadota bacterium]|jgi:hypothetical protein
MIVSIEEATRLVGKSRSTINRAIKAGKLSKTPTGIDTAELMRVYGELMQHDTPQKMAQQTTNDTSVDHHKLELLQVQMELLRVQLEQSQESVRDLRQRLDASDLERRQLMQLLTHQANATTTEEKPIAWVKRFFNVKM